MLLSDSPMSSKERPFKGNLIYQPRPRRRVHWVANPMRDPLVVSGEIAGHRARLKPRARDRREFEPMDVRDIRKKFHQTRFQFADMLGISIETLRNWERGRRCPLGPARALLRIAAADPDVVAAVLVRNQVEWGRADDPDVNLDD
jgi:putative transcriptional regulator